MSGRGSAWLERLVRDQEVGGSNPLAPTNSFETKEPRRSFATSKTGEQRPAHSRTNREEWGTPRGASYSFSESMTVLSSEKLARGREKLWGTRHPTRCISRDWPTYQDAILGSLMHWTEIVSATRPRSTRIVLITVRWRPAALSPSRSGWLSATKVRTSAAGQAVWGSYSFSVISPPVLATCLALIKPLVGEPETVRKML